MGRNSDKLYVEYSKCGSYVGTANGIARTMPRKARLLARSLQGSAKGRGGYEGI